MSQLGDFLRKFDGGYGHLCPGCSQVHFIAVEKELPNGAQWTFDGNIEAPTFGPSIKVTVPIGARRQNERPLVCHYFLKAGQIEFCGDSTHELAGKTVPLPVWPI